MQSRLSQVLLFPSIVILILSAVFLIDIRYIYAASLKDEAETYRMKGYDAQEKGDIDAAITWYQKAAGLDIDYAAPHNDLGILFEAKGWLDRAEVEYQKALAIDPNYEKAHTNMALLYERKGELEKAAYHWMRRYKLGEANDPWTYEARQRLEKLGLIDKAERGGIAPPAIEKSRLAVGTGAGLPEQEEDSKGWSRIRKDEAPTPRKKEVTAIQEPKRRIKDEPVKGAAKQQPVAKKTSRKAKPKKKEEKSGSEWTKIDFSSGKKTPEPSSARDAALDKELQESLRLAEERLKKERGKKENPAKPAAPKSSTPKSSYQKTSSTGARSHYLKAQDYFNKGEYARAMDTIRTAKEDYPQDTDLLKLEDSIKLKMKEERIEDHYNEGIMNYRQNDYSGAREEFEAILNILPE